MRLLLDECVPAPLRHLLRPHDVATVRSLGWLSIKNGELVRRAEADFDVFITADKNLRYQQDLTNRKITILQLPTNSWKILQQRAPEILDALEAVKDKPGSYQPVTFRT
jgi:predicted nuclease of predicted toxin-antitoxin system